MFRKAMFIICIFALLTACTAAKATPTPTPLPPTDTLPPPPTNTPRATDTPLPTYTPHPTWTPRPTAIPYPVERAYAQIIYNPKADQALMFSGTTIVSLGKSSYEAWLFDPQNRKWEKASAIPSGCEWYDFSGVYDSQADRFLLYCSGVEGKDKGKLVEYDFTADAWSDRKSTNTPQGAHITRMAYDAESQKTILVGGISFTTTAEQFNETWAYDYASNAWTKMSPKTQPPGYYAHTLVYDSESDRVVLWGGCIWAGNWGSNWTSTVPENLVWAYNYNADAWESFPVTDGPVAPTSNDWLQYIGSAYNPDLDRILYYWENQFWSYDYNHNAWEKAKGDVVSNAGFRHSHGMAYITSIQRLLVFGGNPEDYLNFYDDTWLYYPQTGDWTKVGP